MHTLAATITTPAHHEQVIDPNFIPLMNEIAGLIIDGEEAHPDAYYDTLQEHGIPEHQQYFTCIATLAGMYAKTLPQDEAIKFYLQAEKILQKIATETLIEAGVQVDLNDYVVDALRDR